MAGWDWGAPASRRAPETPARSRAASPLVQLLRYVAAHRKYAALTVLFGITGFLLSFVYPWIIGSAVDLVTVPAIQRLPLAVRAGRLVHLTELSWKHITHPKEFLKVGQEVKAEVISIDPENKRIGLSMKRQEVDPWDTVAINYQIGQLVQGIVTKMTKFGAFVRLVDVPEIEGLVHISELSDQRVAHPREVLQEGETVTLRVVKMDIEDRRLGLSLKKVNSAEYLDIDWG